MDVYISVDCSSVLVWYYCDDRHDWTAIAILYDYSEWGKWNKRFISDIAYYIAKLFCIVQ